MMKMFLILHGFRNMFIFGRKSELLRRIFFGLNLVFFLSQLQRVFLLITSIKKNIISPANKHNAVDWSLIICRKRMFEKFV